METDTNTDISGQRIRLKKRQENRGTRQLDRHALPEPVAAPQVEELVADEAGEGRPDEPT